MISVIVKTHNCEDTICDCLESVKDFGEIIVVDEHSCDDTVDFARAYRANIVFCDKSQTQETIEEAVKEAKNKWVFIVEDDEIISKDLFLEIKNKIENTKNLSSIYLAQKVFYLRQEIKSAQKNKILRIFRKDCAEFNNGKILVRGKSAKIKKNYILKYLKNDTIKEFRDYFEDIKIKSKKNVKLSLFLTPLFYFIKIYFLKRGIFDGKKGFIYCTKETIKKILLQIVIFEKGEK